MRTDDMAGGESLAVLQNLRVKRDAPDRIGAAQEQELQHRRRAIFGRAERCGHHGLAKNLAAVGTAVEIAVAEPAAIAERCDGLERDQRLGFLVVPWFARGFVALRDAHALPVHPGHIAGNFCGPG
ncbi:hypothetical protein I6F38_04525 [Bradyrhizobium sp. BRP56]|nr:hypothetical protein [Bradyrhizobium sp. BRP56]